MNERDSIYERYRREMMEMYEKAKTENARSDEPNEEPTEKEEECPEHESTEEGEILSEEESAEIIREQEEEEKMQNDVLPSFCRLCGDRIALCDFKVENASGGMPIENAQIMLYRGDGYFVRVLTDESGRTCEIPIFADTEWRISVTAQGYISVSKAAIEPVAGEKLSVPVRLDESLSLCDIFAESKGTAPEYGIVGT